MRVRFTADADGHAVTGRVDTGPGGDAGTAFDITLETLDLGRWLGRGKDGPDGGPGSGRDGARDDAAPRSPLGLRALSSFSGSGTLRVGRLLVAGLVFEDVTLPLSVRRGRASFRGLAAGLCGGRVTGGGAIDMTDGLAFDLRLEGRDIGTRPLLAGLGLTRVAIDAAAAVLFYLRGHIVDTARVAEALDGYIRVGAGPVTCRLADRDGRVGERALAFSRADASGTMRAGVLRSEDIAVRGENIVIGGEATVDFRSWTLDLPLSVSLPVPRVLPAVPLRLRGPLGHPSADVPGPVARAFRLIFH